MVRVVFNDDRKPEDFTDCDSFGISAVGDLILVKLQTVQTPEGIMTRGDNKRIFSAGMWLEAEVIGGGDVRTPGQVIVPNPGGQNMPPGIRRS